MSKNLTAQFYPDPEIISLSVDTNWNDGRVIISYAPTTDTTVKHFVIYRIENGYYYPVPPGNFDPVGTTFTYTEAKAHLSSKLFTMQSIFNDNDVVHDYVPQHHTIFLEQQSFNACEKSVDIIWNNYVGWAQGIFGYELWVNRNGLGFQKIETIQNDTISTIKNINPDDNYEAYVIGISSDGVKSFSNKISLETEAGSSINPNLFYIDTVIYDGTNVDLMYNVDNSVDVLNYDIQIKNKPDDPFRHFVYVESTGANRYHFIHNGPDDTNPGYYRIQVNGLCDDSLGITNIVRQLILQGSASNNIVSLTWNYSFDEFTEDYTMWVDIDGTGFTVLDDGLIEKGKQYNLVELSGGSAEYFCFRVTTKSANNYYSESNTLCFTLTPEVEMPTAFSPNYDGLNDLIGPTIKYADISTYQFIVYDRFGGVVFETDQPEKRWDGKAGNKNVSEGAYLYYIKFTTNRGKVYEKTGAINVVYP